MTKSNTQDITRLLKDIRSKMATKEELRAVRSQMATKQELRALRLATKEDLVSSEKRIRNDMATKDDLEALHSQMTTDLTSVETRIRDDFGYKLISLETRLREATKADLETAVAQIIKAVDKSSADKEEVARLKTRVDRIEDHLNLPPSE